MTTCPLCVRRQERVLDLEKENEKIKKQFQTFEILLQGRIVNALDELFDFVKKSDGEDIKDKQHYRRLWSDSLKENVRLRKELAQYIVTEASQPKEQIPDDVVNGGV